MADRHDDAEKISRALYVRIGSVSCPELGGEQVFFNRFGFRHLVVKHGIRRPLKEIRRRLALLPYAQEIIGKSGKLFSHQEKLASRPGHRHGKKVFIPVRTAFWRLTGEIGNKKITVIIRQFQGGKKHFLSIYDTRNKKLPS